jgi:hypothetical protein
MTSPGIESDSYYEHKTSLFDDGDEPTDELEFSQKNYAKRIYVTSQKRANLNLDMGIGVQPT